MQSDPPTERLPLQPHPGCSPSFVVPLKSSTPPPEVHFFFSFLPSSAYLIRAIYCHFTVSSPFPSPTSSYFLRKSFISDTLFAVPKRKSPLFNFSSRKSQPSKWGKSLSMADRSRIAAATACHQESLLMISNSKEEKAHINVVVIGHVDSGKSTTVSIIHSTSQLSALLTLFSRPVT